MLESSNQNFDPNHHLKMAIAPEKIVSSGGTPKHEHQSGPEHPHRRKLIAGLTLAAVLATGGFIYKATSGETHTKAPTSTSAPGNPGHSPDAEPSATPSATPETTATTAEELIASHEIKAGQDPEALSNNIETEFNNWSMAGSDTVVKDYTDLLRKTGDASEDTKSKFLDGYAAMQAAIYVPALFGADFASNTDPGVKKAISGYTLINKSVLDNIIISSQDVHPYVQERTVTGVVASTTSSISFKYVEHDNASQGNRITDSVNGSAGTVNTEYTTRNNVIVIEKYSITDGTN